MEKQEISTGRFYHPLVSLAVEISYTPNNSLNIFRISLSENEFKVGTTDLQEPVRFIGQRIVNFLDGQYDDFSDLKLDFSGMSIFKIRVLEAARTIPCGRTVTYSELAAMSGYPNAVRAAASVMRNNRFPLIIPCHRVVRKNGSPGGYCGQLGGPMFELKQQLLQMEQKSGRKRQ
ncbi:MAG TPA: MGMT family protein [Chitinispirillaceae bacterium]|nr:MGMT family protein [Chitinispirillaceae bacterium]